jgi:membrane-associated protease RseP (regulator of RpoE activity)
MEDPNLLFDRVDVIIRRYFYVEDKTYGDDRSGYSMRYHGRLTLADSAEAYDRISEQVKPLGLTPLFRIEDERQTIYLIPGVKTVKPGNPRVNLIFFILTLLSVWFTGGILSLNEIPEGALNIIWAFIINGWPFALAMLSILGAHEFGHYLAGRRHGVQVSLPYFLPLPFPISPFGTLGAFISMKELPKNRRILLDISITGPLAGLVVAIPVVLIGLSLSELVVLPAAPGLELPSQMEGNSILYLLAKFAVFGQLLPNPVSYEGLSPVLFWLRYVFTGQPLPYGAVDVILHPVAWAGWGGLLITSLNLIPAGQLDGGHLVYSLIGRQGIRRMLPIILVILALMGFIWAGWWLWAVLIFVFGRVYAEPLDLITPLDAKRKRLAVLALIIFILVFTPVPLVAML